MCRQLALLGTAGPREVAELTHHFLQLRNQIQSCIFRQTQVGQMTSPQLVVLPDFDVKRCAASELHVTRELVEPEEEVTRLKAASLRASQAGHRGRSPAQAVHPAAKEGPTNGASSLHAPAWRVRWDR